MKNPLPAPVGMAEWAAWIIEPVAVPVGTRQSARLAHANLAFWAEAARLGAQTHGFLESETTEEKLGTNEMIKKTTSQIDKINELNIALVAYQMWERAGFPTGQDMEFWLQAQAENCAADKEVPSASGFLSAYLIDKASPSPGRNNPSLDHGRSDHSL